MAQLLSDDTNLQEHAEDVVVYRKGSRNYNEETIWDDTELIQAYNRAVGLAYNSVSSKMKEEGHDMVATSVACSADAAGVISTATQETPTPCYNHKKKKRQKKPKKNKAKQWKVGDLCMGKFSEDGELYEAIIKSVDYTRQTCVVRYVGYENEEHHRLSSLQRYNQSESVDTSIADETADEETDWTQINRGSSSQIPVLPPPPPPTWMKSSKTPSDQEALSSMLMAWYMSGYHTGYYQAQRELRGKRNLGHHSRSEKTVEET